MLLSYYWFDRRELLAKAHNKYHNKGGKQIATIYYERNKDSIKKRQREYYENLPKEKKDKIKERSLKRYYKLKNA